MLEYLRLCLEMLYFASGIALALAAFIGLRQLRISKDNIAAITETAKISARREAFRLAAEQCARYYSQIIPMFDDFHNWLAENGLFEAVDSVGIKIEAEGLCPVAKKADAIPAYLAAVKQGAK